MPLYLKISNGYVIVIMVLVCSCNMPAYLVSTSNTMSNPYIPQPAKTKDEPAKMEGYAGVQFVSCFKTSSISLEDQAFYGAAQIAQAYAFGPIRAAYGGSIALGSFHVGNKDIYWYDSVDYFRLKNGGNKFSGAVGGNASISIAINKRKNTVEWRVIGLQGSAYREFGDYLRFRNQLPGNLELEGEKKASTYTAGIFTEFVKTRKNKTQFGFKAAMSFSNIIHPPKEYKKTTFDSTGGYKKELLWGSEKDLRVLPYYISFTYFLKKQKYCGYIQATSGVDITSFQIGVLYTLGRKTYTSKNTKTQ